MTLAGLVAQLLNGLASASALFLVAAGLSLIFGVTRIVNFAYGAMGDSAASLMTCEPLLMRPQWGAFGRAKQDLSVNFVCGASIGRGLEDRLDLRKPLVAARGTRTLSKADMLRNDTCPRITVDPQTFEVSVDGAVIGCAPATRVPLNRLYMFR